MKTSMKNPPFLPHFERGKFYNFHPEIQKESPEWLLPSIKMYIEGYRRRRRHCADLEAWVEPFRGYERSVKPIITWLGHATMLIQVGELNILADPIFETPSWLYQRILPFGAQFEDLPKIDIVLLSHNHRDHMDAPALKALMKRDNPHFLVPQGDAHWFKKRGSHKAVDHMWWDTSTINNVECTFVPAWHWSQRGIFDHNRSLWGGWVIKTEEHTIYFAGDTAYEKFYFEAIGKVFPQIDVAIMPIGPGDPDELMRRSHMNAEMSGEAFLDCGARYFVPMHWGTFYFGIDLFHSPMERITNWWNENQSRLPEESLRVLKIAQQFHLEDHKNRD